MDIIYRETAIYKCAFPPSQLFLRFWSFVPFMCTICLQACGPESPNAILMVSFIVELSSDSCLLHDS